MARASARRRNQDDVIKAVQHRLAVWTGLPPSHQEDLQARARGCGSLCVQGGGVTEARECAVCGRGRHYHGRPLSLRRPCCAQVLRYGPTNKYGAHIDGLGRLCTVLIYLVGEWGGGGRGEAGPRQ